MRNRKTFPLLLAMTVAAQLAGAEESLPAPPDVAAPPADAEVTESGLASKVLVPGHGTERPEANAHAIVHYTGWTTDGKMFDSSVARGKMLSFPLDRVIEGWKEGLQLMVEGEKRRFWIPGELAYAGKEDRPQGMLVFDVELFDFVSTPADVAAPPADAEVTKSRLASKVLRPGTGTEHPRRSSHVTVHYSGWTTDGERFDSSVVRGKTTTFPLTGVIKGWTEGVQLMVEGEKRRFWIPQKLAYKGARDKPRGMLVFDIELISFK